MLPQTQTQTSLPETTQLLAHRNWRTEWTLERTCLYWYLTFDAEPALHAVVDELTASLAGVGSVDVVPNDWLHLTVLDVGYADEVVRSDVDGMVAAAESIRDLMPLTIELGAVTTMTDAVVLPVAHSPQLDRVHATLTEGLGTLRPPRAEDDLFWPHVSIGYLNSDCHRDEVMAAFADVVPHDVALVVPRLTLAAVTRLQTHYRWEAIASLPPAV